MASAASTPTIATTIISSISDPQYYMYDYKGTSGTTGKFTASGMGDLNGDGNTSTFALAGEVTNGIVFVSPNFQEDKPEE